MNSAVILIFAAIGTLCGLVAFVVLRALVRAFGRWLLLRGSKAALRRFQQMAPSPEWQSTKELVERWKREDPERVERDRETAERAARINEEAPPGSTPHFLGSLTGDGATVESSGTKTSGLVAVVAGDRGLIEIHLVHGDSPLQDTYTVVLAPNAHGGREYLLARGRLDATVPPFGKNG